VGSIRRAQRRTVDLIIVNDQIDLSRMSDSWAGNTAQSVTGDESTAVVNTADATVSTLVLGSAAHLGAVHSRSGQPKIAVIADEPIGHAGGLFDFCVRHRAPYSLSVP